MTSHSVSASNDCPGHAQFWLYPDGRRVGVDARHVEGDRAHADAVDVAFGFLKKEGNGVALRGSVYVVRAFGVHEGDSLTYRNGEFAGREKEVGQVNRGICFALCLGNNGIQADEDEEEGKVLHSIGILYAKPTAHTNGDNGWNRFTLHWY